MTRKEILISCIEKYKQFPTRSIARYILYEYGELWDGNLEKIRKAVSYYLGLNGEQSRLGCKTAITRDAPPQQLPKTWRTITTPHIMPSGKWLILPDIHVPFHESVPLEAAIEWGIKERVTGVFLGGDTQDCQSISFWPSTRKRDFNKEMEMVIDFFMWLRGKFPKAPIVYKPGNHEYRLPRYYQSKAPDLAGSPLAAMESLLGFEERGIEFLDYKQIVMFGKLPFLHGHEIKISRAVNPARGLFLKAKTWAACAHFHTTSEHTAKDLQGTLLTTWSFGCLCDLSPDYNPYGNDWNWGCGIISCDKKGHFEVINKRILSSGAVV